MPHLGVAGASLYYETDGARGAPAVMLLHAGIAQLRMWDPQIGALSQAHFVVRFDQRGFGMTSVENAVATAGHFSDRSDALALLDHLGVDRATVVGCSRGGGIAIDLAVDTPNRIAGLVTIGSGAAGHPDVDETAHEAELYAAIEAATGVERLRLEADFWDVGPRRDPTALDPGFVATARELNVANLSHVNEKQRGAALDPFAYERLGEIAVPTLVMTGDHDVSVMAPESRSLLDRITGSESYRFADAAHIPSVECPDEFETVLLAWLTKHGL